jgi:hypothetical protein
VPPLGAPPVPPLGGAGAGAGVVVGVTGAVGTAVVVVGAGTAVVVVGTAGVVPGCVLRLFALPQSCMP